jgi:tetratricopeptide (TPR) repeat protein
MFELKPEDFGDEPVEQGDAEAATQKCPHCSKTIPAAAARCPHCNLPPDELIQVDLFPKSPYRIMRELLRPGRVIAAMITVGLALGVYGIFTIQPILAESYAASGDRLMRNGDLTAAVDFYRQALHYDPLNPSAHENLAWAEYALAMDAEALNNFEQALKLDPDRTMSLYGAGLSAYRLYDYENAISYLGRVLEIAPEHAGAYEHLGLAEYRLGNYENAYGYLLEASVYNPQNATTVYYLGRILAHGGDITAAIEKYDQAGELGFDPGVVANARGLAWMQTGDFASARDDFLAATLVYPDRKDAILSLAQAFYLLGDHAAAREQLAALEADVPPDLEPDYLALWGWVSLRQGYTDAARVAFNSWVNLGSENARALNALGWATYYSGDCGTAGFYFQNAIEQMEDETTDFHDPLASADETPRAGLDLQCP